MENIAKAIIAVMKDVKGMEKNSRVGTGGSAYNGTKDQDVKEVFNESMSKHGLCILPTAVDSSFQIDRWTEDSQYGAKTKQSVFTEVKTKYLLLHASGESIELAGYGHGIDTQDKGAGKATTYALKNCLLYTFLTPVGKIDDTDTTHSEQIPTPPQPKAKPLLDIKSEQFKKAVEYLKGGGSVTEIEKKYSLTVETKELLISEAI